MKPPPVYKMRAAAFYGFEESLAMLKEMEWRTINNILLELYAQTDLMTLEKKLMKVLRMLIPYTKGYLLLLEPDGNISEEDSCFLGHSEQESEQYLHRFYKKDYLKGTVK